MAPFWVRGAQLGMAGRALFLLTFAIQLHTMVDGAGTFEDYVSVGGGLGGAALLLTGAWHLGRS